jgi:hypothetical protein
MAAPIENQQVFFMLPWCPTAGLSISEHPETEATMNLMAKSAALVLAFSAIALGGCATAQDIRQRDEAACTSYGFQPGTAEFASCLQRESIARRYGNWPDYWGSPRWRW